MSDAAECAKDPLYAGLLHTRWSRRRFLAGAGVAGVAVGAAACGGGGDDGGGRAPGSTPAAAGATGPTTTLLDGDLAVARLAAGLEKMAIDLYDAAGVATGGGKLGAVPLAVAGYLLTARSHHVEHLAEWNRTLEAGGLPPVIAADAGLEPTLAKMLAEAKDLNGAIGLIEVLEEILADTYLRSILTLEDKASITSAGQILIVDQQHRAILNYLLGRYPAPEPFQVPDKAAS